MLTCCRALLVPVPEATKSTRERDDPRVLVKSSNGSVLLNGMFAVSVPPLRKTEGVVEELSPGPAPLGNAAIGEHVLVVVVKDAVADETGVRTRHRCPIPFA